MVALETSTEQEAAGTLRVSGHYLEFYLAVSKGNVYEGEGKERRAPAVV